MKRSRKQVAISFAAGLLVVMAVSGCGRSKGDILRISDQGMSLLVDSSLFIPEPAGGTVSVPENGNIAVEAAKAAESVLAGLSYKLNAPTLISVGARFEPEKKMQVQTPRGSLESPAQVTKPFIVWPAADGMLKSRINQLFVWADRKEKNPPRGSLDASSSAGILLLSCSGNRSEATASVQFLVVDRASGKIVWSGQGRTADVTPDGIAKKVRQLLADLPQKPGATGK